MEMVLMQFDSIKALVKNDFEAVDALIVQSLQSKASIINDLGHYIIQGGGKRLRPLVLLLIAKACGYQGSEHIALAAIIELVHTATLLHDDVVDSADLRRGRQTANTVWGNEAAVLVGDYLYSKAFQIMTEIDQPKILRVLADTTNTMAEGEAFQLLDRHNPASSEGAYLNIIRSKTAKLFEAAALIGAILGKVPQKLEQAIGQYGMHLGTAFQLIDDTLDYESSPSQSGKQLGNDLSQGKVTLPLIQVLQSGRAADVRLVQQAIKAGTESDLPKIQKLIEEHGGILYTKRFAEAEVERAQKSLHDLPESPYREGAEALAQFALERSH
jgi:octaprenyl-diphosphate synthase